MEKESFFVKVKDLIEEYVDDRLLLVRLQFTEKAAKATSVLFIVMAVSFLSLILLMILSFIVGYYLSQAVNSYPGGFGILAVFYILAIVVLIKMHKKSLGKMIADAVVKFSLQTKETFTHEV